jgi:hypothetical protein
VNDTIRVFPKGAGVKSREQKRRENAEVGKTEKTWTEKSKKVVDKWRRRLYNIPRQQRFGAEVETE